MGEHGFSINWNRTCLKDFKEYHNEIEEVGGRGESTSPPTPLRKKSVQKECRALDLTSINFNMIFQLYSCSAFVVAASVPNKYNDRNCNAILLFHEHFFCIFCCHVKIIFCLLRNDIIFKTDFYAINKYEHLVKYKQHIIDTFSRFEYETKQKKTNKHAGLQEKNIQKAVRLFSICWHCIE